jgi:hypothetical protein
MADDFQRLLAGDRRAHRLFDILGVTHFQGIHADRLAFTPIRPKPGVTPPATLHGIF